MKDKLSSGRPSNINEFLTDIRTFGRTRRERSRALLQSTIENPQGMGVTTERRVGNNESIIVLVGPIAAGKGTAADLLIERGYVPFNYGDEIFKERTARGLPEVRKNSHAVAAALRLEFGNDIIAKRLGKLVQEFRDQKLENKILIDGLRHPDELVWMKENLGAQIIGVTASPDVRYQRSLRRNRSVDPKSPEDFDAIDQEDRGVTVYEHGNQTDACLRLADVIIENNDEDLEGYKIKFDQALENLSIKKDREEV